MSSMLPADKVRPCIRHVTSGIRLKAIFFYSRYSTAASQKNESQSINKTCMKLESIER